MARLAIDFDGTLVREDEMGNVRLVEGADAAMVKLREQGHYLIIHTCRTTEATEAGRLDQEVQFIAQILASFGIPYDEIHIGEKLIADAYVDDRAIAFRGDWVDVVQTVTARFSRRRLG